MDCANPIPDMDSHIRSLAGMKRTGVASSNPTFLA